MRAQSKVNSNPKVFEIIQCPKLFINCYYYAEWIIISMQFFRVSGRLHIQSTPETNKNFDSAFETTQHSQMLAQRGAKILPSFIISCSNLQISDPIGQGKTEGEMLT